MSTIAYGRPNKVNETYIGPRWNVDLSRVTLSSYPFKDFYAFQYFGSDTRYWEYDIKFAIVSEQFYGSFAWQKFVEKPWVYRAIMLEWSNRTQQHPRFNNDIAFVEYTYFTGLPNLSDRIGSTIALKYR